MSDHPAPAPSPSLAASLTSRFEHWCRSIGQPVHALIRPAASDEHRDAFVAPATLPIPRLILTVVVAGTLFGMMMGGYQVSTDGRWPLILYAGIKVPFLILGTATLCLLPYLVLNTLLGLRDDFLIAMRAILAGQAALTIVLASLSPLVQVAYFSGISHAGAQLFNASLFFIATGFGHIVMLRHYHPLIHHRGEHGPSHRRMLYLWVLLYAFVGIQFGWILRPYIGVPGMDVTPFRQDAFTNAYVYFLRVLFARSTYEINDLPQYP